MYARVASNRTAAAAIAMRAGIDVDLQCGRHCPRDAGRPSPRGSAREIADTDAGGTRVGHDCGAYAELSRAISEGMLPEHTLREATSRILALKESAGACHGRQAGGGVDGAHTHITQTLSLTLVKWMGLTRTDCMAACST